MDLAFLISYLCLVGALAGFMAGLFGIGGGLVTVPGLYLFLISTGIDPSLAMSLAVSTSLAVIIPTAASSLNAHRKLGNVDWPSAKSVFVPLVAGVLLGSQLILFVNGDVLAILFACMAWLIALKVSIGSNPKPNKWCALRWVKQCCAGCIGLLSVMAGVGGGAFAAPLFMAGGMSVHRAVGTASFFGVCISLPGVMAILFSATTPLAAPPGTYSLLYLPGLLAIGVLATLFAPVGARVGKRLSEPVLKRCFAVFLFVVGLRMFWVVLLS